MTTPDHMTHPSRLTDAQRRENTAAVHDRMASAMLRAGGISAKRDAPVAQAAARKLRQAA
jgi:hypothetical protein